MLQTNKTNPNIVKLFLHYLDPVPSSGQKVNTTGFLLEFSVVVSVAFSFCFIADAAVFENNSWLLSVNLFADYE